MDQAVVDLLKQRKDYRREQSPILKAHAGAAYAAALEERLAKAAPAQLHPDSVVEEGILKLDNSLKAFEEALDEVGLHWDPYEHNGPEYGSGGKEGVNPEKLREILKRLKEAEDWLDGFLNSE